MMARNKGKPSIPRDPGRLKLSTLSERVISEWRGCEEPWDLNKGLHKPDEFIQSLLESTGADQGIHEESLRNSWNDLVGGFVASQTQPVSLKHGLLLIRVTQPALRFQLDRMKPDLISRLSSILGKDLVQTIRFTHG